MKERKNIEHLFQEKFQNFEVLPPEHVWEELKIKLEEKKDKKRVLPFWWKLSGIAAVVVVGLFVLNNVVTNSDGTLPTLTTIENDTLLRKQNSNSDNQNPVNSSIAVSKEVNGATPTINTTVKGALKSTATPKITSANSVTSLPNRGSQVRSEKEANSIDNSASETNKNNKNSSKIPTIIVNNSSAKEKQNTFYNYKKNEIIVSEKRSSTAILKNKKPSDFSSKASFEMLHANKKEALTFNSNKEINEKSILNVENKIVMPKNAFDKTTVFDKDDAVNNNSVSKDTNENALALLEQNQKIDSAKVAITEPNALEELLKEKGSKIVEEPKLNRWQITSNVAPIYFSSTGKSGSSLDAKFEQNSKSYSTDYSYGVGVNYKLNKKLKIRTGVNSVSFNYNTNDVLFYQTTAASKIKNLTTNEKGALLQIESKNEAGVNIPTIVESGYSINKFDSSLNQKLGYIEIPMEMSYALLNKKFSIEIVGGLSTLFLNQNEVYLESSGVKMDIGEANNLNEVHFSGNVGLGFKYGVVKNLEAKIEPVFKYQMNTYTTDTGNFKPYFIGVYTGLTYNF